MTTFYTFNTLVDPDQGADTDIRPFGQFYQATDASYQCYNALFGKGNYDGGDPNLAVYLELQDNADNNIVLDSSGKERHGYLNKANTNTEDISFEDGPTGYLPRAMRPPQATGIYEVGGIAFGTQPASLPITNHYANYVDWSDIPESQGATFITWVNFSSGVWGGSVVRRLLNGNPNSGNVYTYGMNGDGYGRSWFFATGVAENRYTAGRQANNWYHLAYKFKDLNREIYVDGQSSVSAVASSSITYTSNAGFTVGGTSHVAPEGPSKYAAISVFNRDLSDAEIQEAYSGPEPYAQLAPSISGTPAVGDFVTINAGTWNSQNNGVIRYSYKMYSYSDTNGSDERLEKEITSYKVAQKILIRGSRLVGRYLRFIVSAENDGGTDPLEVYETGYTAAITSGTDPSYVSYNALFGYGKHVPDPELKGLLPFDEDPLTNDPVKYGEWQVNPITGAPTLVDNGPTSYLTKAVRFDATDGTDDVISFDTVNANNAQDYTIGFWLNVAGYGTGGATGQSFDFAPGGVRANLKFGFNHYYYESRDRNTVPIMNFNTVAGLNTWHHIVARNDYGTRASLHLNGSEYDFSTNGFTSDLPSTYLGIGKYADQDMTWFWLINRVLSDTEVAESYNGPEPVNITAPSIFGDFRVGFVITATGGTWDNQNNGSVTATYQWYRADDINGTNLTAIAGATGSTYELSFDDHQKYVTVRERASNDGGYDELEDTFSTYSSEIGLKGGMLVVKAG